jgi:hypothetical protein
MWQRGEETPLGALGSPLSSSTTYGLCLYDTSVAAQTAAPRLGEEGASSAPLDRSARTAFRRSKRYDREGDRWQWIGRDCATSCAGYGNGVIDGHEWEQVRQLVIQRLEREEAEAIEAGRLASAAGEAFAATAIAPGSVASAIYEIDLSSTRSATSLPGGIAEADEMVLEQQGGLGQLFEGMVRRRYSVFSTDGSLLGSIDQVENEMMQDLTNRSLFEVPDLHFRVTDGGTGETTTFRRSQGLARDGIDVIDPTGMHRASVEWKFSLLGKKFAVQPAGEGGEVRVKGSILRPFTLEIRDCVSGLGAFLTGGNRMRIRVRPGEVTPEQRWGLLAAALLADLSAEDRD